MKIVLDTDILSHVMRQNSSVLKKAKEYLKTYPRFTFSIITSYEILRGLKAKNALKQLQAFETFSSVSEILSITPEIISRASDIYADLYRNGDLIGDADILIAATALAENCVLATNNEKHFSRIKGLNTINWLA
jgi:tRNA(fMet)-specific endonuclease VapC